MEIPQPTPMSARLKQDTMTPIRDAGVAAAVKAVRQYALRRDAEGALQQHSEFTKEGLSHVAIDNAALDACSKACDLQAALSIWDSMSRRDLLSYNTMITCCAVTLNARLADELWSQLQQHGLRPNLITYTAMMNVQSQTSNLKRALLFFDEMLKKKLQPDSLAYLAAMSACARVGGYTQARKLFMHMNANKVAPQHRHYNALITACSQGEHGEVAEVVFRAMPGQGFEPDHADYSALIRCWRNDAAKCQQLLKEMEAADVHVDQNTLQCVIEAELSAGNTTEVATLIQKAKSIFGKLTPPLQRIAGKLKH